MVHNNFGGGFGELSSLNRLMRTASTTPLKVYDTDICSSIAVFDEDRVALNAMKFSSPRSAGASCMVMDGNGAASSTTHAVDHSMDQVHRCCLQGCYESCYEGFPVSLLQVGGPVMGPVSKPSCGVYSIDSQCQAIWGAWYVSKGFGRSG